MESVLTRRVNIDTYIVLSSVAAIFLQQRIGRVGVDIFLGYPLIVFNAILLLALDRLLIHRNHAIIIATVSLISVLASISSGTPTMAIIAQVIGICVFSVYFFSVLFNTGVSVPRWLEIYMQFALVVAVIGVVEVAGRATGILPEHREVRLRSIFAEPSFYVYVTLPAISLYISGWLRTRQYGPEILLLLGTYVLANSSLGFLGLLLIASLHAFSRLSFGKLILFGMAASASMVALYFASLAVRIRVDDTVRALNVLDLSNLNASSFAVLSNAYVTMQTFLAYPLFGIGLGGYQYAYTKHIPWLGTMDSEMVTLNMHDASSLFFRNAAELGIFGLIALFAFLIGCARVRGQHYVDVRNALLPYLLIRMTRYGAWFSLELYFFVGLYLLNYMQSRAAQVFQRKPQPDPLPDPQPTGPA